MHVEFLVEEPSAEEALRILVPRILPSGVSFDVHAYQGKADLLGKLESRLRGYSSWIPADFLIVVLVDEDRKDCHELKGTLEESARRTGLLTCSAARGRRKFAVLNRIAVEEFEAWYLGDVEALVAAYPGVPPTLARRKGFRDPDAVPGGTWEALERVLKRAGYHRGGLAKVQAARDIAPHMDPLRNRSRSFKVFRDGLLRMSVE